MSVFNREQLKLEGWPPAPTRGMRTGGMSNGVKVTHSATGIYVIEKSLRSTYENKLLAIDQLEVEVNEYYAERGEEHF